MIYNNFNCVLVLILQAIHFAKCSSKISPSLQAQLDKGDKVNVLVSFNGTGDICRLGTSVGSRSALAADRGEVLTSMKNKLAEKMATSQNGVLSLLSSRSASAFSQFTQFWITNQLFIGQADSTLVQGIAQDSKVSKIIAEPKIELLNDPGQSVKDGPGPKPKENGEPQQNIKLVNAPEAWNELGGKKGDGILIGIMDTGVLSTHESLKNSYVGQYGWYDPGGEKNSSKPEPYDEWTSHGTLVTGFAVGSKGIGVAPNAKWSACKICRYDHYPECQLEDILKCGQWFTCPTLANGTNHDCSKAPHIINNSWGGAQPASDGGLDYNYFDDMLECWHTAGIIPVFAIGNSGKRCNTVEYPGYTEKAIGVGNVNIYDVVSAGSSRGPTDDGRIKPDIVAPGKYILSASSLGDDKYHNDRIGTSYAAPHVSGAIALPLNKNKELNFKQIKQMLIASADQTTTVEEEPNCGNITADVFPNHVSGYGRLNILKLLKQEPPPAS